jgi:XRE family transcriptional regulator, aerobic/anaerobic benzoate catabolism transcriptional regulator
MQMMMRGRGIMHVRRASRTMKTARQPAPAILAKPADGDEYLTQIGKRVRELRARRGMTRKILARDSQVSERYLAQLESGEGNISILLLRQIAQALDTPVESLVYAGAEPTVELVRAIEFLRGLRPEELTRARDLLSQEFGGVDADARSSRIALVGLRGAGKSTLGAMLARKLDLPFIELDRLIEQEAGVPLGVIFDLYGQSGFRRLERRCLDEVIERFPKFVLATGGSLVSEPGTFDRLLTTCFTVWLRATPEDHMQRVIAQGDKRPMADNREAMTDLQRILAGREKLYGQADVALDTSGFTLAENFEKLASAVKTADQNRKLSRNQRAAD